MADVVVSKEVFFIGAWRTQNVTEHLLQQISKQMHVKEGYSTLLSLTHDGLYLNIQNNNGQTTKTDRIPLEIIADFINNKYVPSSTCILAKVKDKTHYTVFVFLCRCREDSAVMVQEFQKLKKQLSGEGYNLDMRQTGVNWTLKNKDTVDGVHNGEVRAYSTAVRGNNGVGVGDSVSNTSVHTDVREELTDLAKEVRDIRLMMQKSHGRHHFAKHYGYLNSPKPEVISAPAFTTQEVVVGPTQVTDYNVKRHYIKREPSSPGVTLVHGQGGLYKQRQSTSSHFVRAPSTSSVGTVRRRVYPSPAPAIEANYARSQVNGQVIRVVNPNPQVFLRREVQRSSSSDIVPKNIERVYKSKRYRRIIPVGPAVPPVQHQIYDYVQSQQQQSQAVVEDDIAPVRSVFIDEAPPKVIKRAPTHIKYDGEHLYENSTFTQERRDLSNVSTLVNVSSNDLLDDESEHVRVTKSTNVYRQSPQSDQVIVVKSDAENVRRTYDEDVTTTTYHEGGQSRNVVVVSENGDDITSTSRVHEEGNVIYVKSDYQVVRDEPQKVVGGEVIHVRAKGLENFESDYYQAEEGGNVVVVNHDEYQQAGDTSTSNMTVIRGDTEVVKTTPGVTVISHADTNEGIWGAYAKEPEPYDPDVDIVEEKTFRYKDGDEDGTVDINELQQELNEEIANTEEVPTPKRVGFLDDIEQTIEDQHDEKIDDINGGIGDVEDRISGFENKVGDVEDNIGDKMNDVEGRVDEADNEVRDIINKIGDDENNNANRIGAGDNNDISLSKGSVMDELKEKFTNDSEANVLF